MDGYNACWIFRRHATHLALRLALFSMYMDRMGNKKCCFHEKKKFLSPRRVTRNNLYMCEVWLIISINVSCGKIFHLAK